MPYPTVHNAVVQTIRMQDRRPLHLPAHMEIATAAYRRLYGADPGLDPRAVAAEAARVLEAGGYPPRGGAVVRMSLAPDADVTVECCGMLLYAGYAGWHTRLRATVTRYDSFPYGEPCLTSLLNAAYAGDYARRKGFDAAVHVAAGMVAGLAGGLWCCGTDGVATRGGAGEYPLFLVHGGVVSTLSPEAGATDSVPRRLGLAALRRLGVDVYERAVEECELLTADEVFSLNPQGIAGLLECDGALYYSTLAERVAGVLPRLAAADLLTL